MILVISCFGLEGWVWHLIASVPDLCILLPSKITSSWQNKIVLGNVIHIAHFADLSLKIIS